MRSLIEIGERCFRVFGVHLQGMALPGRTARIARARQAFFLIARREGYDYREIGAIVRRDRGTVRKGIESAKGHERVDPDYAAKIAKASK